MPPTAHVDLPPGRQPSEPATVPRPTSSRSPTSPRGRRRAVITLVVVVVAALLLLSRCSRSVAGRGSLATIVGDWWVTYGAPAVVTITRSDGGYLMTAKTPVRVATKTCDLPSGTEIATFKARTDGSFAGQHGLWEPTFETSRRLDMLRCAIDQLDHDAGGSRLNATPDRKDIGPVRT